MLSLQLENFIQMNIKTEMAHIQQNVVQNQTAAILEIGTSLLSQTAEQTRKLTDVETQVLNQTSRIEIQLLENSLSTNKLERQLLMQTNEIHKLQDQNSLLETRVQQMETKHLKELEDIRTEKDHLQQLVSHQSNTIEGLEKEPVFPPTVLLKKEDRLFQDCTDVLQSGFNLSGVYTLQINNLTEPKKGFGAAAGEYWLGNEAVHLFTNQAAYALRVELLDWEGNRAYAHYDKFRLANERQRYRLALRGYKGSAGWWFDACGQSNLNGIYYPARHNIRKLNGVRWHYFQGPGYSLKATRMMIRLSSSREGT
ncbi:hypothetical protein Chor_002457 [Crotalus horridus]